MKIVNVIKEEIENYNNLISYEKFDDIKSSEWRKLAQNGRYNDAITYMLNYLNNKEDLENHQIGGILWHIGQLYAFAGDYKNSILYMSKPEVSNSIEPNYQQGTISFLKGDLKNLKVFYEKLVKNDPTGGSGRDILMNLIKYFGKTYKEIY